MKPQNNFEIAAETLRIAAQKVDRLLRTAHYNNPADKTATIQDITDRLHELTSFVEWLSTPALD